MFEATLVLGLIALVLAVVVPRIGAGGSPAAADAAARVSLGQFLAAESARHSVAGAFSDDPALLAGYAPALTFVTDPSPSTSPSELSVVVSGDIAAAAALSTSGSCWYLRTTFNAVPGGEPVLWAVDDTPAACAASEVLDVVGDPGQGADPTSAVPMP